MKSMIIVALALVAIAAALPVEEPAVQIVKSNYEQAPNGGYTFEYETSDGSKRQEIGEVKEVFDEENKPHNVVVVRGTYSYPNGDGTFENIAYQANENGYTAEGPSVPKVERR